MAINLQSLVQHINANDFVKAESEVLQMVRHLTDSGFKGVGISKANGKLEFDESIAIEFSNQFIPILFTLFSNPNYSPDFGFVEEMIWNKSLLESIFNLSKWQTPDPIMQEYINVVAKTTGTDFELSGKNLYVFLMLISAGSKFKIDWKPMFEAAPDLAMLTYIAVLSVKTNINTKQGSKGAHELFKQTKNLPLFKAKKLEAITTLTASPFFSCSYYNSGEKYAFKKWLVELYRYNIHQHIDTSKYVTKKKLDASKKQKLLVVVEQYGKNHAMKRCYHDVFVKLSEQYELVALTHLDKKNTADLYDSVFSEIVNIENTMDVESALKLVSAVEPDIIYYPSVGMSHFGIYLSQLRLAPLQMMSGGHPSSSFSPEMDYFLIPAKPEMFVGLEKTILEEVVMYKEDDPDRSYPYVLPLPENELDFITSRNSYLPFEDTITVGINGVVHKASYDLIKACKTIRSKVNKKVKFVFFQSSPEYSVPSIATKIAIERELDNIDFYYNQDYKGYMSAISKCHFCLPTYPFGGSNSNIDAQLLNKPKLFIHGKDYKYTQTDHYDWCNIGLDDDLSCKDLNQVIDKAINFINNEDSLRKVHQNIVDANVLETVFVSEDNDELDYMSLFNRCIEKKLAEQAQS